MSQEIALFCQIHPESPAKQQRVTSLLRAAARDFYRQPAAKCTTWTYFTPFPAPKPGAAPVLAGLEIYTEKAALSEQSKDTTFFQPYHKTVKDEKLYSRDEELVAWYHEAGFLARGELATPFGSALVSITSFVCKDRTPLVAVLRDFAMWVDQNEPDVLTYAVFVRPKAPKEVMLFVRYADKAALKSHSIAPEHVEVGKKLAKLSENNVAKATTLWQEIEDGFVSTQIGASLKASKL